MTRLLAIFTTLWLVSLTSLAAAQPYARRVPGPGPGTKGTVTAWDETQSTVLEHRSCVRTRYSWSYSTCASIVRSRVKATLCAAKGPGMHGYIFQLGNNRPTRYNVYCRR